jgi:hypothetical protein
MSMASRMPFERSSSMGAGSFGIRKESVENISAPSSIIARAY